MELMTMPPAWFNCLYMIAMEKKQEQHAKELAEQAQADAIEEAIEEGGAM